jgi:lipopolysaccharide biosynthesis regulator YciM
MLMIYGTGTLVLIGLLVGFHRPIAALWYGNLGSIEMAKVELRNWPENRPETHIYEDGSLDLAIHYFQKALGYHSQNRAANYRLGRIAMERRDFPTAVEYLERAFLQDQHYHGIRKNLGYAYVFIGQIEAAYPILGEINEAEYEMRLYNWWWSLQGRDDLAAYAMKYVDTIP